MRGVSDGATGAVVRSRARWMVGLAAAGMVMALPSLGLGTPDAIALSDGRAYEMVSPVDSTVDVDPPLLFSGSTSGARSSKSGDTLSYSAPQAFAGSEAVSIETYYLATRGTASWATAGLTPPLAPAFEGLANYMAFTSDLTKGVVRTTPSSRQLDPSQVAPTSGKLLYLRDTRSGTWRLLTHGPTPSVSPTPVGGSEDFSSVVFEEMAALTPDAAVGAAMNLYEWNDGELRVVGVLPDGTPAPGGAVAGSGVEVQGTSENAVSDDGSQIVFTSPAPAPFQPPAGQVYARRDGTTTVHVSASRRAVPDPNGSQPADFRGATPDGSKIFFVSGEKLTEDATTGPASGGRDLYRYDADTGDLVDLTVSSEPGDVDGANVLGVAGISDDGDRVYFVATGSLAAGATSGEPNLYLWQDGSTRLVTTLAPGDMRDWAPERVFGTPVHLRSSRVSPDGRRLAFSSTADHTAYQAQGATQIYLYDAQSESIVCPSCSPSGEPPSGPVSLSSTTDGLLNLPTDGYFVRNLSEDGERLIFDTPDALVPSDVNGARDVYMYAHGELELMTPGNGDFSFHFADASADGDSVFFKTRAPLSGADEDDAIDLYVSRVGGGVPEPDPPGPCRGEACQGSPKEAPSRSGLGSEGLDGPGDERSTPRASFSMPRPSVAQRRRLARGHAIVLRVRVSRSGRVRVVATTRLRGATQTVARSTSVARRPGTLRLRLRLSRDARLRLARGHKLSIRLAVRFSGAPSPHAQTLDLRRGR